MTEHLPTRVAETPSRGLDRRKLMLLSLAAVAAALPGQAQTEKKPFSPEELDQLQRKSAAILNKRELSPESVAAAIAEALNSNKAAIYATTDHP